MSCIDVHCGSGLVSVCECAVSDNFMLTSSVDLLSTEKGSATTYSKTFLFLQGKFYLQGNHPRPNTDFSMKTIWAISTRPRMIFGHFKSGKKVF